MTITHAVEIITPVGQIGYGYPIDPFLDECSRMPTGSFIIADAGSTDSGPQKLCFGITTAPKEAYFRDLRPILQAAHERHFKVLIGSCGGHGSNTHVDVFTDIVRQICEEQGYVFKVAKIYSEVDHKLVKTNITNGTVVPCGPVPALTGSEVDAAPHIVAQMGCEPFIKALEGGADIVLAGRAYDPSPYAAVCTMAGIDPGIAWHMGKICECGAMCATPRGKSIRATVRADSFDLTPVNPFEKCIPQSVAAHTLYEKSRPDLLPGPGGVLDVTNCTFEAISDRTTRISGAKFVPGPYTVKLEGAKPVGYRAICQGGVRDPILISQIDTWLSYVSKTVLAMTDNYDPLVDLVAWHVYGKNGVMGELEPDRFSVAHELLCMGEVLSNTQARAMWIGNRLRVALLHTPYPGQMANSGNVAFPYAPFETALGQFAEFNIYHIIPVSDGLSLFPIEYLQCGEEPNHKIISNGTNGGTTHIGNNGTRPRQLDPYSAVSREIAKWVASAPAKKTFAELVQEGRKQASIAELARICRSKNAGPYEMTIDVMFTNEMEYQWVKSSGVLNKNSLATLYNTQIEQVQTCMFFDPALAFKFTIPRPHVQAGFGETDMHAAQEYLPVSRLKVDLPSSV